MDLLIWPMIKISVRATDEGDRGLAVRIVTTTLQLQASTAPLECVLCCTPILWNSRLEEQYFKLELFTSAQHSRTKCSEHSVSLGHILY